MKKLSFLLIVILFLSGCNSSSTADKSIDENLKTEYEVAVIMVSGMHCGSCENTIATALTSLDGVEEATASVDKGGARVKFDPTKVGEEDFTAAIEGKGYEVIEYRKVEPKKKPAEPVE